jgi:hypothetical protein
MEVFIRDSKVFELLPGDQTDAAVRSMLDQLTKGTEAYEAVKSLLSDRRDKNWEAKEVEDDNSVETQVEKDNSVEKKGKKRTTLQRLLPFRRRRE